jgi:hypothetical protein
MKMWIGIALSAAPQTPPPPTPQPDPDIGDDSPDAPEIPPDPDAYVNDNPEIEMPLTEDDGPVREDGV